MTGLTSRPFPHKDVRALEYRGKKFPSSINIPEGYRPAMISVGSVVDPKANKPSRFYGIIGTPEGTPAIQQMFYEHAIPLVAIKDTDSELSPRSFVVRNPNYKKNEGPLIQVVKPHSGNGMVNGAHATIPYRDSDGTDLTTGINPRIQILDGK